MGKSKRRGRSAFRESGSSVAGLVTLAVVVVVALALVIVAFLPKATPPVSAADGGLSAYATSTPASEPTPTDAPRETFAQKLASDQPTTLVVVGDSTGFSDQQWVYTFARDMSEKYNRTVDVSAWSIDTNTYGEPARYGEGTGASLVIWNGSAPGMAPRYSQENLAALIPADATPDLIVVSHGHNTGLDPVLDIKRLTNDITAAKAGVPLAVTVQNPVQTTQADVNAARATAIRDWIASEPSWTMVDVYTAFTSQPDLATLYLDARHPNEQGGRVWADTFESALGV